MLEIIIIICLALAFFLVLRHFPETKEALPFYEGGSNIVVSKKQRRVLPSLFLGKILKKNQPNRKSIEEAIAKDNDKVVAPVEVNEAILKYEERDPEIARKLHEAEEAYEINDLRTAEEKAIDIISQNKRSSYAYIIIGKVAQNRGSFDDAKSAFKTAIKCNPEIGEAYFGLGQIELKDENYTDAIIYLQKAVNLDRGIALWYAELGRAYSQVRQFAKAAKALKRASSLDIDNKEFRDMASEAEDKQRSHSMAISRKMK